MALGLEQALAVYLSSKGIGGLYDDGDPAQRVIFVEGRPPASPYETDPTDIETSADSMVMIAIAGGAPPTHHIEWSYSVKVETRHPDFEGVLGLAHGIFELLHDNGGSGSNTQAQGDFSGIKIIRMTADFPPYRLGRDPNEEGGRMIMTQTFTVRVKPFSLS